MTGPDDPYAPPGQQPGSGPPPAGPQPGWGPPPPGYARPTNTLAIASLVLIFVFTPAALVTGIIARRQIRQTGEQGDGFALAGIIAGVVSLVVIVLLVVVFIIVLAVASTTISHLPTQFPTVFPSPAS